MRKRFHVCFAVMMIASFSMMAMSKEHAVHTFEQGDGTFLLDGKPFVVKAGELHYLRIPEAYWEHRILMCKAMGLNTICTYCFWNIHEPEEGKFNFTGRCDVARFIALCKKHGMYVIVRPGPYGCGEWDMGGLPWWLLKKKDIKLRSQDPRFMEAVSNYERRLSRELEPYRIENGGNIIITQIENEFGSYGKDKPYMVAIRDTLRAAGWDKTMLMQCDWSSNFQDNALDDVLWTLNFGAGADVDKEFSKLNELRPHSPKMCSEYWTGWFTGWGSQYQTRDWQPLVDGMRDMLDRNISFSLYMAHGGTSFGQWAGANNRGFAPDVTNYDFNAPINEQGCATEKFYKMRELLQKYTDEKLPSVPKAIPVVSVPQFDMTQFAPLYSADNLPDGIDSYDIESMEQFGQGWGSIIYSCDLPKTLTEGFLSIKDMCDYAIVFVDGELVGRLYRGNGYETTLRMPACPNGGRLEIFVEAMGRINYSRLIHDRKGITDRVELLTSTEVGEVTYNLKNWRAQLLPVDYGFMKSRAYKPLSHADATTTNTSVNPRKKAGYYKAEFLVSKVGDTYLDLSTWGKGLVWVNGECLGRFWNYGPQQALYLPGCWLKKGRNEVVVMDIVGPTAAVLKGLDTPCNNELHKEHLPQDAVKNLPQVNAPKSDARDEVGNDAGPGAK